MAPAEEAHRIGRVGRSFRDLVAVPCPNVRQRLHPPVHPKDRPDPAVAHRADALTIELEEQQRREQRQDRRVRHLDHAGHQPALLAVDNAQSALHHDEVLGVSRDEDRDGREDRADHHDSDQRQDVLGATQRLIAVVVGVTDAVLDVTFLGIGRRGVVAPNLLASRCPAQDHRGHGAREDGGADDLPGEQRSDTQDVSDDDSRQECRHPDQDNGERRALWRFVIDPNTELVPLAQRWQMRGEGRQSFAAHDSLGQR